MTWIPEENGIKKPILYSKKVFLPIRVLFYSYELDGSKCVKICHKNKQHLIININAPGESKLLLKNKKGSTNTDKPHTVNKMWKAIYYFSIYYIYFFRVIATLKIHVTGIRLHCK